ncbi:YcxB family protein [Vibrio quintilis]|uniref:YcxB-like C-terminal domain-containing protein n=1 Tax=Vibrio quintilis TaxID=1117707 RepID=A0A1M7YWR8_9VIBR|nr:YcxB family protein [Vibrio quintilis]SHO57061.1 hypothetical protein VQ7734_02830 [Vibrio quintilis]
MEITYKPTYSDFCEATKYIERQVVRSTKWRYLRVLSKIILVTLFALGLMSIIRYYEKFSFISHQELTEGLLAIEFGIIIFFIISRIYHKKIRALMFEDGWLYLSTNHQFRIEQDYLLLKIRENQHQYRWKYVRKTEKTKSYIFIFMDRGSALFIARHSFQSDEHYNTFYTQVTSRCMFSEN